MEIMKQLELHKSRVLLISMDSFYKPLTADQKKKAAEGHYNFDHPDAFDYELITETLKILRKRDKKTVKCIEIPEYDFKTHSRLPETQKVNFADVILFEGILSLHDKRVRALLDMKLFVDTDNDICLARRVRRDIAERGRDVHGVLTQYDRFVKPAFDYFILPTKKYADLLSQEATQTQLPSA